MKDKLMNTHYFCFNAWDNSGEQLILKTEIYDNGDNHYFNQELKLNSYCNSVVLRLYSAALTPDILRKLADELEESIRNCQPKNT